MESRSRSAARWWLRRTIERRHGGASSESGGIRAPSILGGLPAPTRGAQHRAVGPVGLAQLMARFAQSAPKNRDRSAIQIVGLFEPTLMGVERREIAGEDSGVGIPLAARLDRKLDRIEVNRLRLVLPAGRTQQQRQIVLGDGCFAPEIAARARVANAKFSGLAESPACC